MHEKIHLVQNPWLLLRGGCYSEGCYWEVIAIRRGVIGRWLLFGGVLLGGGCYLEGCYWEMIAIRRDVIGRWLLFGGVLLGGGWYSEGCYWEGPLYQSVIHDSIFHVFLTNVKINAWMAHIAQEDRCRLCHSLTQHNCFPLHRVFSPLSKVASVKLWRLERDYTSKSNHCCSHKARINMWQMWYWYSTEDKSIIVGVESVINA